MNSQILPLHRDLDLVGPGPREPQKPIGALLVDAGRLTEDEAERIHDYQQKVGLPFGEAGISMGLLTDEDVRHALALQFGHASISPDAGLGKDLVAAYEPDSPAVEHLRSLRAQLMLRWFENETAHQQALAVVSAGPGEGRSYITANLAVLFAQMGKRTLVIDADLRKPRQHRIFGVPGKTGLSSLLAGRAGAEVLCEIKQLPGLTLLPAGVLPPNPQELLSRPQFQRLVQSLHGLYEVILIDTPAASSWADAETIAARAGAALMVTCRDRSSMPRVIKLSEDLKEFGVTVVGAVLNGAGAV
ncbi:chain length determinant protein tyrosine kinase EpsG [Ramlibacter humi]|uniref:Chain length determinant protein tyrosine kinase EpsG n=1 Tax=Ramlibacter humi TaxID=2530451 RepID=A0A4Z0BQ60_9BURK|nr:chain length determinant protein tyrosine kinase EpsG [Ramlibacter humi]TFZ00185.1 chain length determinant protein tyrosine kinase EpsG [Ramlibacter humi]